ncbi:MAG: hypothetical protein ACTHMQ_01440, partial [Protaetiibacter sp.]
MSASTPGRTRRAANLAEKVILGFIAGAAASIALVDIVFLVQRIVGLATPGPTTLVDAVLNAPLEIASDSPFVTAGSTDTVDLVVS